MFDVKHYCWFFALLITDLASKAVFVKAWDVPIFSFFSWFVSINPTLNTGLSFSCLENFAGFNSYLVAFGLCIFFLFFNYQYQVQGQAYAEAAVLAGGVGNFVDRLVHGGVVDFLCFGAPFGSLTINLADIFIFVGLLVIFFRSMWEHCVQSSRAGSNL